MQIGQPALWLFDCRCSGSFGPWSTWDIADYAKAMMQMRLWMRDVLRYMLCLCYLSRIRMMRW